MDYSKAAALTAKNGEPGYLWLDNAQKYSRMNGIIDNKDYRARGTNPCGEITLESAEFCNLVETYPSNHNSLEEWVETLKYAYMYSKTVTLIPCHDQQSNSVMLRNRRIGCSISGIAQAFNKFGRRKFLEACKKGYDEVQRWDTVYSEWLCIPRSIKMTTIKPSGSVSLLAGTTPGIHYPYSQYYFRTIRFQEDSPLLEKLQKAGYKIETDKYSPRTKVVYFPVEEKYFERSAKDVSMWEQLEIAAQIQEVWADNQVSVTVTFNDEESKELCRALELYETRMKSVSFLPYQEHSFEQAPYIPITKEEYEAAASELKKVVLKNNTHEITEKFCDSDVCLI
jgi:adenosylcobalamin-dependent ribonucleoside-triphosphate reductase